MVPKGPRFGGVERRNPVVLAPRPQSRAHGGAGASVLLFPGDVSGRFEVARFVVATGGVYCCRDDVHFL